MNYLSPIVSSEGAFYEKVYELYLKYETMDIRQRYIKRPFGTHKICFHKNKNPMESVLLGLHMLFEINSVLPKNSIVSMDDFS